MLRSNSAQARSSDRRAASATSGSSIFRNRPEWKPFQSAKRRSPLAPPAPAPAPSPRVYEAPAASSTPPRATSAVRTTESISSEMLRDGAKARASESFQGTMKLQANLLEQGTRMDRIEQEIAKRRTEKLDATLASTERFVAIERTLESLGSKVAELQRALIPDNSNLEALEQQLNKQHDYFTEVIHNNESQRRLDSQQQFNDTTQMMLKNTHFLELKLEEAAQQTRRDDRKGIESMLYSQKLWMDTGLTLCKKTESRLEEQLEQMQERLMDQANRVDPTGSIEALRDAVDKLPLRDLDQVHATQQSLETRLALLEQSREKFVQRQASKFEQFSKAVEELRRDTGRVDDARTREQDQLSTKALLAAQDSLQKHSWSEREHFDQLCKDLAAKAGEEHAQLASTEEKHYKNLLSMIDNGDKIQHKNDAEHSALLGKMDDKIREMRCDMDTQFLEVREDRLSTIDSVKKVAGDLIALQPKFMHHSEMTTAYLKEQEVSLRTHVELTAANIQLNIAKTTEHERALGHKRVQKNADVLREERQQLVAQAEKRIGETIEAQARTTQETLAQAAEDTTATLQKGEADTTHKLSKMDTKISMANMGVDENKAGLTELATAFGELQEQVDEGGADEIAPLEARVALLEGDFQEVQIDLCLNQAALMAGS